MTDHSETARLPDDERPADVARMIEDLPAADGAAVLEDMPSDQAADVAEILDPGTAADMFKEMDPREAAEIIGDMEAPEASVVLGKMDPDDRVDVLEHVSDKVHDELIGQLEKAEAAETLNLERYDPATAGGLMTTQVTALREGMTVAEAINELRRRSRQNEQLFYSYVVDKRGHLIGVLSMRDLILAEETRAIVSVMIPNVRSLPAAMDQEEVARLFKQTNFLAMPVVDDHHRLLGIVTVDDVIDVLEEETTEDVQRMFGAGPEERLTSPWSYSFKTRIWWLVVNLATAFMAAAVVGVFEETITQLAILAAYMPIVAGMGGNASAQAMAIAVRGLAVGRVDRALMRNVIRKEATVGLLTGLVIGTITFLIAFALHFSDRGLTENFALGGVVALALVVNHTLACASGAAIPFLMKRLGFDPAQSATIFATTVTDVAGFFVLLGLAWICMPYLK